MLGIGCVIFIVALFYCGTPWAFHIIILYKLCISYKTIVSHEKYKIGFNITKTRLDVYETLCPQQMLVNKGGQIKNWSGECRDVIPTKMQCQTIQRALESPNLQREIIQKK